MTELLTTHHVTGYELAVSIVLKRIASTVESLIAVCSTVRWHEQLARQSY